MRGELDEQIFRSDGYNGRRTRRVKETVDELRYRTLRERLERPIAALLPFIYRIVKYAEPHHAGWGKRFSQELLGNKSLAVPVRVPDQVEALWSDAQERRAELPVDLLLSRTFLEALSEECNENALRCHFSVAGSQEPAPRDRERALYSKLVARVQADPVLREQAEELGRCGKLLQVIVENRHTVSREFGGYLRAAAYENARIQVAGGKAYRDLTSEDRAAITKQVYETLFVGTPRIFAAADRKNRPLTDLDPRLPAALVTRFLRAEIDRIHLIKSGQRRERTWLEPARDEFRRNSLQRDDQGRILPRTFVSEDGMQHPSESLDVDAPCFESG